MVVSLLSDPRSVLAEGMLEGIEEGPPVSKRRLVVLWVGQLVFFLALRYFFRRLTKPKFMVYPRQSWLLKVLNVVLWPACVLVDTVRYKVPVIGFMLVRPLSIERLALAAERRTGLSDWGESKTFPSLYEMALRRMNEVKLSPFGRLLTFDYLLRRLELRLHLVKHLKEEKDRPELTVRPMVVMGLPRTGTTLVHRLLALDPEARYPKTFELLDPLNPRKFDEKKRINYVKSKLNLIKRVIPHIEAIHELGPEEAEECFLGLSVDVPMLPPTFRHLVRHCVGDDFLVDKVIFPDLSDAYRLYKRQLQCISSSEKKRWVLKCPAHLGFVSDLYSAFPDADIVWTHRDPAEALPSLGSLFRTFADMAESHDINLHAIGQEQLVYWAAALQRAHKQVKQNHVAHVHFESLMADPIKAIEHIYATFNYTLSDTFRHNMTTYLKENQQKRATIPYHLKQFHTYSLQDYGLHVKDLHKAMHSYYANYLPTALLQQDKKKHNKLSDDDQKSPPAAPPTDAQTKKIN